MAYELPRVDRGLSICSEKPVEVRDDITGLWRSCMDPGPS